MNRKLLALLSAFSHWIDSGDAKKRRPRANDGVSKTVAVFLFFFPLLFASVFCFFFLTRSFVIDAITTFHYYYYCYLTQQIFLTFVRWFFLFSFLSHVGRQKSVLFAPLQFNFIAII